jgi:uncharacterized membrane protein
MINHYFKVAFRNLWKYKLQNIICILFALVFVTTCLIVLLSIFEKVRAAAKENPAEVVKSE